MVDGKPLETYGFFTIFACLKTNNTKCYVQKRVYTRDDFGTETE